MTHLEGEPRAPTHPCSAYSILPGQTECPTPSEQAAPEIYVEWAQIWSFQRRQDVPVMLLGPLYFLGPCTSGLAEGNGGGKGPGLSSKVESEKGSHIRKLKEQQRKAQSPKENCEEERHGGKGPEENITSGESLTQKGQSPSRCLKVPAGQTEGCPPSAVPTRATWWPGA